jgi:hypothetical protein
LQQAVQSAKRARGATGWRSLRPSNNAASRAPASATAALIDAVSAEGLGGEWR